MGKNLTLGITFFLNKKYLGIDIFNKVSNKRKKKIINPLSTLFFSQLCKCRMPDTMLICKECSCLSKCLMGTVMLTSLTTPLTTQTSPIITVITHHV